MTRAVVSIEPPGDVGTMTLMAWSGKSSAPAMVAHAHSEATKAALAVPRTVTAMNPLGLKFSPQP